MADEDAHDRSTRHFAPNEIVGWQYAIASLERLNAWAVSALRLGILWLLNTCVAEMSQAGAKPELIKRAQELLSALDRLPRE